MTLIQRRRALMAKSGDSHKLPSEYQRVEYVKNPNGGGAYFQTNISFGIPFKISCVAQVDTAYTNYSRCVTGSRSNGKNYDQINFSKDTNNFGFSGHYSALGNCIGIKTTIIAEYNARHKLINIKNSLGEYNNDVEDSANISGGKIAVFEAGASLVATQFRGGRIYEYSVINPNTKKEQIYLIPCYRKTDGKTGMYDTVSKTFFTSDASTDFEKGADI